MVIVNGKPELNETNKTAKVSLFADSQGEVTSEMTIVGMPAGYELAPGSSCLTADKDFGMLDSLGVWHW